MDSELKAQADALFAELGMNISTAFNIFVRQAIREGGIPFEISINQPKQRDNLRHARIRENCERPVGQRIQRFGRAFQGP